MGRGTRWKGTAGDHKGPPSRSPPPSPLRTGEHVSNKPTRASTPLVFSAHLRHIIFILSQPELYQEKENFRCLVSCASLPFFSSCRDLRPVEVHQRTRAITRQQTQTTLLSQMLPIQPWRCQSSPRALLAWLGSVKIFW